MKLLHRYIAVSVLKGTALTLAVLVMIAEFVELVRQVDDIGTADYQILTALVYVVLRLPKLTFEMLPAAALPGALLGLGNLAAQGELTVIQTIGFSRTQLLGSVSLAGLVLVFVMVVLGESMAPSLNTYARQLRVQALHQTVGGGQSIWLKDGNQIVNVTQQTRPVGYGEVYIYELNADRLKSIARADSASVDAQQRWIFNNYSQTRFGQEAIKGSTEPQSVQHHNFDESILKLAVVDSDFLDMPGLKRYIAYLQSNDLDARAYLIAYWTRIREIISVLFLTAMALPFVAGGLRSTDTGWRVFVGLIVGLGYYAGVRLCATGSDLFGLDPKIIVLWLPISVLAVILGAAFTTVR